MLLKHGNWRALQSKPTDASEPIQLELRLPLSRQLPLTGLSPNLNLNDIRKVEKSR
ncbi:MAG TPA: hypothetical protein VKS22_06415 [Candidatus Binataceae bacterium]|nr:hypothetical protein [Candidatus Binataceae bacterium]